MSQAPVLAPDAAMALGIASTAMPFARTREEAVERWLRVLRSSGRAGAVLQALGVSEGVAQAADIQKGDPSEVEPRESFQGSSGLDRGEALQGSPSEVEPGEALPGGPPEIGGPSEIGPREAPSDAVAQVAERAAQVARERGAPQIATTDLLMAVVFVYGTDFDRVLRAHGTDRGELIAQLAA